MKDQLRGCIRITAKGKNLYRFINMIHCGRIMCFEQFCRNDTFFAEIYRHDLAKVKSIAEECGIELEHRELPTLSSKLLKYRRRIGLLIGAVFAVFIIAYFSNVVVTIEIQGNNTVCDEDILAVLDELGIRSGAHIRDLDLRYCENELRVRVKGVSWAAIRRTGNRIVVDVTEVVPAPEAPKRNVPCNIVSSKDAQITDFTVLDGFLMHKIGDHVRKGSLLVSGVTSTKWKENYLHHAMGEIIGKYDETVVFSGSFETVRNVLTGNECSDDSLRLFSLDIPLSFGRRSYEQQRTEVSDSPLVLFGKELPVSVVRRRNSETSLETITLTPEELESELNRRIFIYEKNFIPEETKVIDRTISKEVTASGITLTVNYTLEGNIGIEKELLVKSR